MNRQMIKKTAGRLSLPFPMKWLRKLSGQYFIFPFYHLVTDNPSPCVKHLFPAVSEKQFKKDLDFLLQHFSPADFPKVLRFLDHEKKTDQPRFFLSFDDGFAECFHVVAPVLKAKGIPAAFFVNPSFIGNKQLSHRQKISLIIDKILQTEQPQLMKQAMKPFLTGTGKKMNVIRWVKNLTFSDAQLIQDIANVYEVNFGEALIKFQPYLNLDQIRQLKSDGFTIGSHSLNHAEFSLLSEEEMKQQVESSFQFLETSLNTGCRAFSFPFHDIGVPASFFSYLAREANVAVSFGTSGLKNDDAPRHIQRIPLEVPGFHSAKAIIRSEYFYYLGKTFFGKNRIRRWQT